MGFFGDNVVLYYLCHLRAKSNPIKVRRDYVRLLNLSTEFNFSRLPNSIESKCSICSIRFGSTSYVWFELIKCNNKKEITDSELVLDSFLTESTGFLDLEVLSSKENVSITINGQQVGKTVYTTNV